MRDKIPRRHLFKGLKSFYQIWPFEEGEDDFWMEDSDPRPASVKLLATEDVKVLPLEAERYLNRRLHDSRVIRIDAHGDSVSLVVDDYDVWRLSTAYESATGVRQVERFFPLILEFANVKAWAAYQSQPLGKLNRLRHSLRSSLENVRELVGDKVVRWDDMHKIVFFEFRARHPKFSCLTRYEGEGSVWLEHWLLLAIDASMFNVHELQLNSWREAYGADSVRLLESFQSRRLELAQGPYEPFEDLVKAYLNSTKS